MLLALQRELGLWLLYDVLLTVPCLIIYNLLSRLVVYHTNLFVENFLLRVVLLAASVHAIFVLIALVNLLLSINELVGDHIVTLRGLNVVVIVLAHR